MDGIMRQGVLHVFSVDDAGRLVERYGDPANPIGVSHVMPEGWCRTGAGSRVTVIPDPNDQNKYTVAALREDGVIANVAHWNGSSWTLRGWPPG